MGCGSDTRQWGIAVLTVALAVLALALVGPAAADPTGAADDGTITVTQNGTTWEVDPISTNRTVVEFYDYRNWQANTPVPLRSDSMQVFFYEGPRGLSLVTVVDKPFDNSESAATLVVSGLSVQRGDFVVQDDNVFNNPDRAVVREDGAVQFDWESNGKRTDGGAFRGGLAGQNLTIVPRLNERAYFDRGGIDHFEVLGGNATSPRRIGLDLTDPIEVSVPRKYTGADRNESDPAVDLGGVRKAPTDVDGDGRLEDVDGDGQFDRTDVMAYYEHRDSVTVRGNPQWFDFDGDGAAGSVSDALALFEELEN
jgi:PKD repeat protein